MSTSANTATRLQDALEREQGGEAIQNHH
jgi:hypothetical protein